MQTFGELRIGDTFDWIGPGPFNSFFLRCTKIGPRTYRDSEGMTHRVGSEYAEVYHVQDKEAETK